MGRVSERFEIVCEIEPATRPDLMRVRHQIGVLSRVASSFLISDTTSDERPCPASPFSTDDYLESSGCRPPSGRCDRACHIPLPVKVWSTLQSNEILPPGHH